jgi:hypothetical protein
MGPDDTSEGAFASDDVCTLTPTDPCVAAPIVKPLIVTVNTVVFPMAAPKIVSMTAVLLVAPHVTFRPTTLLASAATTGETNGAKKLGGYVRTKVPPDGMYASGEKASVTEMLLFPAIRSNEDMVKYEYMGPDDTGLDAVKSALVDIVIPELLPLVAEPMVRPVRVMMTAALAFSVTVPVVMTMDVAVRTAALPVAPELIATPGVDEAAKKSVG